MTSPRSTPPPKKPRGPFRVDQLKEGDRYELADGHPVYCAPAGVKHGSGAITAGVALATDPAVKEAGLDVGFQLGPGTLRAPDVAIGGLAGGDGWAKGAPELAVEYASIGQDEISLRGRVSDLLEAGTRFVWVVRLVGERRVEVHTPDSEMTLARPGDLLEAPGILENAVPVEVLFDRSAAKSHALQNLLQRAGVRTPEELRALGREEGREEGREALRELLFDVAAARGWEVREEQRAVVESCTDTARLQGWVAAAATAERLEDVLRDD